MVPFEMPKPGYSGPTGNVLTEKLPVGAETTAEKQEHLAHKTPPQIPVEGIFVLPQGLEPWTPTLRVSCSTN